MAAASRVVGAISDIVAAGRCAERWRFSAGDFITACLKSEMRTKVVGWLRWEACKQTFSEYLSNSLPSRRCHSASFSPGLGGVWRKPLEISRRRAVTRVVQVKAWVRGPEIWIISLVTFTISVFWWTASEDNPADEPSMYNDVDHCGTSAAGANAYSDLFAALPCRSRTGGE